jgi:hypothetical protein
MFDNITAINDPMFSSINVCLPRWSRCLSLHIQSPRYDEDGLSYSELNPAIFDIFVYIHFFTDYANSLYSLF